MSYTVIDARGWQNTFDLKSGKKAEVNSHNIGIVKNVLKEHPYPGDLDPGSNRWVTDTALDLVKRYDPDFTFLIYSGQMYTRRFNRLPEEEAAKEVEAAFYEAGRFIEESGFSALIIGTGDMMPVKGYIDLLDLHGLAVTSNWSTRYSALYDIDEDDYRYIQSLEGIERIAEKDEFVSLFPGVPGDTRRLPDYMAVAAEGYCIRSTLLRKSYMVPAVNESIAVSGASGNISYLTGIKDAILESLQTRKTAVIILEGVGTRSFRLPFSRCSNGKGWYYYEPGGAQYLAMSTGADHVFVYPPSSKLYMEEDDHRDYPFSGYFTSMPEGTVGSVFEGRSIAVGNKSTFMHTVTGTDIAIECFARNLSNQGCMGVVHREAKPLSGKAGRDFITAYYAKNRKLTR